MLVTAGKWEILENIRTKTILGLFLEFPCAPVTKNKLEPSYKVDQLQQEKQFQTRQ